MSDIVRAENKFLAVYHMYRFLHAYSTLTAHPVQCPLSDGSYTPQLVIMCPVWQLKKGEIFRDSENYTRKNFVHSPHDEILDRFLFMAGGVISFASVRNHVFTNIFDFTNIRAIWV